MADKLWHDKNILRHWRHILKFDINHHSSSYMAGYFVYIKLDISKCMNVLVIIMISKYYHSFAEWMECNSCILCTELFKISNLELQRKIKNDIMRRNNLYHQFFYWIYFLVGRNTREYFVSIERHKIYGNPQDMWI